MKFLFLYSPQYSKFILCQRIENLIENNVYHMMIIFCAFCVWDLQIDSKSLCIGSEVEFVSTSNLNLFGMFNISKSTIINFISYAFRLALSVVSPNSLKKDRSLSWFREFLYQYKKCDTILCMRKWLVILKWNGKLFCVLVWWNTFMPCVSFWNNIEYSYNHRYLEDWQDAPVIS